MKAQSRICAALRDALLVAQAFQLLCKLYVDVWSCVLALRSQHTLKLRMTLVGGADVVALWSLCVDQQVVVKRSSGLKRGCVW